MPLVRLCKLCGKSFKTKSFFVRRGQGKYCSLACARKSTRTGKVIVCSLCGGEVYKQRKAFRKTKSGKLFCSKSCQTKWRNSVFVGERHANWVHGLATYRTVLNRTNVPKKCARCGLSDKRVLAVHHIDHNRKNNKLKNLMWLCHNCHHLIHHDKVEEQKLMVPIV